MKQYGDVVVYTQNGKPLNALVVNSVTVEDQEQLTLVYLDPALQGATLGSGTASKAFSVKPLAGGLKFGWSEMAVEQTVQPPVEAMQQTAATA